MSYFVYNGRSSEEFGLRIESKNIFSAPEYDMGSKEQLQRMSEGDKQTLETIGMKLKDEQGQLRPWDTIVDDYMRDVWDTLAGEQKIDALLILTLIKYRLENGFIWD